ncbi:MAG: hypothetical protein U0W40_16090 [Acidimicrobiia bacterium]
MAEAQNLLPQMIYFDPPLDTAHRALVSACSRLAGSPASNR